MKRRAFNVLAAVSLALCVAIVALWVRSYFVNDLVNWISTEAERTRTSLRAFRLRSGMGGFAFWITDRDKLPQSGHYSIQWVHEPAYWYPIQDSGNRRALGFELLDRHNWFSVTLPYWCPALILFSPVAGMALARLRRWRRTVEPRCSACGYDLRATPDRCPECGAVPANTETTT